MRSQLQRVVRRLSGGNKGSSSSTDDDESLTDSVQQYPDRRACSVERPGWAARAAGHTAPSPHVITASMAIEATIARRTRHMSNSSREGRPDYCAVDLSRSLPPERTFQKPPQPPPQSSQQRRRRMQMLQKADSSPLPERSRRIEGDSSMIHRRSSQPSSGAGHGALDQFPFCPTFTYSLGSSSPFPCGSEAVMINSKLAHDAFIEQQQQQQQQQQQAEVRN